MQDKVERVLVGRKGRQRVWGLFIQLLSYAAKGLLVLGNFNLN